MLAEKEPVVASPAASEIEKKLRPIAAQMGGLAAFKTRYRPYICPFDWMLSEIPDGARLYDIGCGSGVLPYLAITYRNAKTAHGYDVHQPTVAKAALFKTHAGDAFAVAHLPVDQTPPDLSAYDTVTMIDVLHHIPPSQQQDFLSKMAATMPSGSRLVFKDIDASQFFGRVMNQLHDLVLAREWVHPRSRKETVVMLETAGFRVLRHETRWTWWYPHFLIVAEK